MAWGNVLSQIGGAVFGEDAGALINFGGGILDQLNKDKDSKNAKNAYYAALAQQRQMAQLATATASQRAEFERAMKERLLTQTNDMGTNMRAAQVAMGAMPQFDQGRVDQDYRNTKATMMNDFTDMLKLVESQGRASQIERLGGAGSMTADNDRMNALMKKFTPELQKVDDAAYDSALSRATNTQSLISKNRSDTLGEIESVYDPQIKSETNLLTGGGTDISGLIYGQNSSVNEAGNLATNAGQAGAATQKNLEANLGDLLDRVFNKRT